MKYRDAIRLLTQNGYVLVRQKGSHRQYEGWVDDERHLVTIACHSENEDILPHTLQSIIRQSGLSKKLFR